MSRVGKNPVVVPSGVECQLADGIFQAKGKGGQLSLALSQEVVVKLEDSKVAVTPRTNSKHARQMWGTTQRLISNIVTGVSQGFTKRLEITGVGYRAAVQGSNLQLQLGFSHDIVLPIPSDLKVQCDKPTSVSISGIDRQRVGQFAANVRSYRPPEPYKGKGVKYENEFILRKEGKKK